MFRFVFISAAFVGLSIITLTGCQAFEDPDFNAGMYQLHQRGNWQAAVQYFQRSVERHPKRWKGHLALLEALSRGDNKAALEAQLKATLSRFPDSARSVALQQTASTLLGEAEYEKLAYSYHQKTLGDQLARKGDKPQLLARGIEAACRTQDTVAAMDYTARYLKAAKGAPLPDTLRQDLAFFLGAIAVDWAMLNLRASQNPNDPAILKQQVETGVIAGFYKEAGEKLKQLANKSPETLNDVQWSARFGALLGAKSFAVREMAAGWDGCWTPDGNSLVYVKDLGKPGDPDQYFYRKPVDGTTSDGAPLLKAGQQNLRSLAWPRFSPDGQWLYFFGSVTKDWEPGKRGMFYLYRARAVWDAEVQRLTDADILPVAPYIERDGSVLIVRRDLGSVRASVEVMRLNPRTRSLNSVVRIGEPVNAAVFTPNGDTLIFATERGLMRRALSGGAVMVDFQWPGLSWMFIAPDGRWLAVNTKMQTLLLIDRTNGEFNYLGHTAAAFVDFNKSKLLVAQKANHRRMLLEIDCAKPLNIVQQIK